MEVATATSATAPIAAATPPKTKTVTDYETFLQMLTTQLQNQDPLNPVESSDFAVQLATFSGVEQQVQTNDLLAALTTRLGAAGLAEYAGWVGKEVRAAAPAYYYGEPISVFPNPDLTGDKAMVVVRNALGTEVGRYEIDVSNEPVSWSGLGPDGTPMPDGLYTFQVESYKAGALLNTRQAEVYAMVTEIQTVGTDTMLVLPGDIKIKASSVMALRNVPG